MHLALTQIWSVVADANGYVDGQAPWALRKTDPARMETVLYVLAEAIRHLGIVMQPFMPAAAAKLLDQLCVAPDRRSFAHLGRERWCRARRCRRRTASSRASSRPRPRGPGQPGTGGGRGGGVLGMLVDSHCHLDFPEFAAELDAVVARAQAAGVGAMLTISTHLSRFERVLAIAERFDSVYCTVGVHPHEAASEGTMTVEALTRLADASEGGRHRRDRARLLLRAQPARRRRSGASGCTSRRRGRPACR